MQPRGGGLPPCPAPPGCGAAGRGDPGALASVERTESYQFTCFDFHGEVVSPGPEVREVRSGQRQCALTCWPAVSESQCRGKRQHRDAQRQDSDTSWQILTGGRRLCCVRPRGSQLLCRIPNESVLTARVPLPWRPWSAGTLRRVQPLSLLEHPQSSFPLMVIHRVCPPHWLSPPGPAGENRVSVSPNRRVLGPV